MSKEAREIVEEPKPEDVRAPEMQPVQENYENTKHDPYAAPNPREPEEVASILPRSHGHAHLAASEPAVAHVDLARFSGTGKSGPHDIGTELDSIDRHNEDLAASGRRSPRIWDK